VLQVGVAATFTVIHNEKKLFFLQNREAGVLDGCDSGGSAIVIK
jgi:hypothetical protein